MHFKVHDFDDAYANGPNIPSGEAWPEAWVEPAQRMREALGERAKLDLRYDDHERAKFDLFYPEAEPKGLVIFVHGGFWVRLEKSYWSHLAKGALERGYACAMPSYPLCPEVRVRAITGYGARAIEKAADLVEGPIFLSGHSAGGQIVTRLISEGTPLSSSLLRRLSHVFSISGLHDLRPLLPTVINQTIGLDEDEANSESPALLKPIVDVPITCWVGANERSEFQRQNALLANIWRGLGMATQEVSEPDRHHFDVVDGLADPNSEMIKALLFTS